MAEFQKDLIIMLPPILWFRRKQFYKGVLAVMIFLIEQITSDEIRELVL